METRECQNCHNKFTIESDDFSFYEKIKSNKPKIALNNNPNLLEDIKESDLYKINNSLSLLKKQYEDLSPFVLLIKESIPDITEKTHLCAAYLLLCRYLQIWQSIFILLKSGNYSSLMTLVRSAKELSMLVDLFSLEYKNETDINLKKWFSGVIISHESGRIVVTEFLENEALNRNIDIKKLQAYVYQMESLIPHAAYISVLENVSPFTEDFDFEGYTGFRRTTLALGYVKGTMDSLFITLKLVYSFLLNDNINYSKINQIFLKYNSDTVKSSIPDYIKETFKKY
jgi:hypothetical protein